MMKGLITFMACLKLSSGSYSYADREISSWGERYPNCYGQRQSPIKLDPSTTKNDPKLKDVSYSSDYEDEYSFNINYADGIFEDFPTGTPDGNQMIAEVSGDGPTIEDSFFDGESYRLKYIRCAVAGDGDKEGSEHKIGYQSYVGECQFYHVNTRTEATGTTTPLDENSDANGWAVLAFFLKATERGHNEEWDKLIMGMMDLDENIDSANTGGATTSLPISDVTVDEVTPSKLIPKHATDFYFYQGSVTHPPCIENVNWHIFTKPIEISDAQLVDLQNLMNANTADTNREDLFPNSRPIQHLNLRKVIGHIKKKSHSSSYKSSSRKRHTRHSRRNRRRHHRPSPHRRPHHRPGRPHYGPGRHRTRGYSGPRGPHYRGH